MCSDSHVVMMMINLSYSYTVELYNFFFVRTRKQRKPIRRESEVPSKVLLSWYWNHIHMIEMVCSEPVYYGICVDQSETKIPRILECIFFHIILSINIILQKLKKMTRDNKLQYKKKSNTFWFFFFVLL